MQSPTPFLRLVAKAFIDNYASAMRDFCFIFPNRRSGVFFTKELSELAGNSAFMLPEITSIAQFVSDITDSVEVSKIEALLILYKEYCKIIGDKVDNSFDKFSAWGDTVLNDFNDTDKYLVEPRQLFRNIKDLKEIQSNYLNEAQLEAIKKYFGETPVHFNTNPEKLWKDTERTNKFASLWDILYDLYIEFNCALDEMGVSYSGKIYKSAVEKIRNMTVEDFKHTKYIFVGFNVLSTSEYQIFKLLGKKGIADYYWDYNSPTFDTPQNKATRFVGRNIQLFKSQLDLHEEKITSYPSIKAIGIPSNIGQVKYSSVIIDQLIDTGAITDIDNATNTAIVLPEEFMLVPMLDSINTRIKRVNITMGYPLRYTSISSLVGCTARLHRNARKEQEEFCYFHENIREVLTHPLLKTLAPDEASALITYINQNNLFYVPQPIIDKFLPSFNYIFDPIVHTTNVNDLFNYIDRIINFAEKCVIAKGLVSDESVEMGFISAYVEQLNILRAIIRKYDIQINDNTFFYLVDRIISSVSVAFEGEPLMGLQIMGILETRCLDFDNVIILSMNERIFPRKHYSRSYIPYMLRKANGMATVEFQECMYAYYFYRLISRAKNVTLLFDSRTQSISSGEPSRFVYQLKTMFRSGIIIDHLSFDVAAPSLSKIAIPKSERIMQVLNQFCTEGSGKFLSASAINKYINCPLAFYFEKIENINVPDEMMEFMDASTQGTIVHAVLQELFKRFGKKVADGILVDEEVINTILSDEDALYSLIHLNINEKYMHIPNCDEQLNGETIIVGTGIFLLIKRLLQYDKATEFTILQTEQEETLHWKINENLSVNIKQFIDRVDRIDDNGTPCIRIIDYKTGHDKSSAEIVANMFKKKMVRPKALLQLMLYCNIYNELHNIPEGTIIRPIVYTIPKITDSGFKVNRKALYDYREINDEYLPMLKQVIEEIFDPNVPFRQATDDAVCKYCKLVDFCRK